MIVEENQALQPFAGRPLHPHSSSPSILPQELFLKSSKLLLNIEYPSASTMKIAILANDKKNIVISAKARPKLVCTIPV